MNSLNNTYPTVATIIGCPEELKRADGLVATPIVLEEEMKEPSVQQLLPGDTSMIKDPVQKAVVDNILGNVSTKPIQEKHRCDICNIEVSARAALLSHLSGARHAKKMKEEVFDKEPLSPYIEFLTEKKMYQCTLCNATLNAKIQIIAHLQGSKHRNKAGLGGKDGTGVPSLSVSLNPKPAARQVDHHSATLVCTACNVYVNSETQLQQHTSSRKHISRVNSGGVNKARSAPYPVGRGRMMGVTSRMHASSVTGTSPGNSGPSANSNMFQRRNSQPSYRLSPVTHTQSSYSLSNNFVSSGVYGGPSHSYSQSYSQSSYRHQPYPHTYG